MINEKTPLDDVTLVEFYIDQGYMCEFAVWGLYQEGKHTLRRPICENLKDQETAEFICDALTHYVQC
jgi:hypothetical protein